MKKRYLLTERAAWAYLAGVFSETVTEEEGLCWRIGQLEEQHLVGKITAGRMRSIASNPRRAGSYRWQLTPQGHRLRSAFALARARGK